MIESALYDLLGSDTAVSAIVGARIFPLVAPQDTPGSHVAYQRISGVRDMPLNGPNGFVVARYQVNAFAPNAELSWTLSDAIRHRLDGFMGDRAGHHIQRIWADGDAHFYEYETDGEALICQVIQDYRIAYGESFIELDELTPGGTPITPATVTFLLTKDAFIRDTSPTTNFGNNENLKIGVGVNTPGTVDRPVLHFDLSQPSVEGTTIPSGATMTAASIAFTTLNPTVGGAAKARRLTQAAWVELQATWNNYATGTPWTTAGGDYTVTGEVDWSLPTGSGAFTLSGLAALCQDALSNRASQLHLLLMNVDEATDGRNATFRDSEYGPIPSQRPLLTVSYE